MSAWFVVFPRLIFGLILILLCFLPSLPFLHPPHLFTPVDGTFLRWYVCISAALGFVAFFGLFMWGNWKLANSGLSIVVGILGFLVAAVLGIMAGFSAPGLYGYYELVVLPHQQRQMLYAVPSIRTGGRGGDFAWVRPYGLPAYSLPLSRADDRAYLAGDLRMPGLCYRVTELSRGDAIGIVNPSLWDTPDALVRCRGTDPRRIDAHTPRRV